jgi:hypothetical protein
MEAIHWPDDGTRMSPDDTIPTWNALRVHDEAGAERESCSRLASERPTLPPPGRKGSDDGGSVMVSHIHLGPSVDEVLYRLSMGDFQGAALANAELEGCVPTLAAPPVIIESMRLPYLEEFVLALVDGTATWGLILDTSPFAPRDTLRALCELVDKGAITLS